MRHITCQVPNELHKKAKLASMLDDKNLAQLLSDALKDYCTKIDSLPDGRGRSSH